MPTAAALCPLPDYAAHLHVASVGYHTKVVINGIPQTDLSQTGSTDIVIGGLREGQNTIELQIESLDEPTDPSLRQFSVSVYVLRREERKPPVRVFHYAPEEVPTSHQATILATPSTINQP